MKSKIILTLQAMQGAYTAYAENVEGIWAVGESPADTKRQILDVINRTKEKTPQSEWPQALKEDWPLEWHLDIQSLLLMYADIISYAALERLTGINRKQLWMYAKGISKPRKETQQKIEASLHALGEDLQGIRLWPLGAL